MFVCVCDQQTAENVSHNSVKQQSSGVIVDVSTAAGDVVTSSQAGSHQLVADEAASKGSAATGSIKPAGSSRSQCHN